MPLLDTLTRARLERIKRLVDSILQTEERLEHLQELEKPVSQEGYPATLRLMSLEKSGVFIYGFIDPSCNSGMNERRRYGSKKTNIEATKKRE